MREAHLIWFCSSPLDGNEVNFDHLRTAVVNMTSLNEGEGTHDADVKYGLKNTLYYLLLTMANLLKGAFLQKKGEEESANEVDRFITVLKMNQNLVFGDAKYHINRARQERLRLPSRTPQEADIDTLKKATIKCIEHVTDNYELMGKHEFITLRNAVCSRLTLFNARRGGEPSRLNISQWLDRGKWMPEEQVKGLDEIEQKLIKSMAVTYQAGKGNKLVPCLVPMDCMRGMDLLCEKCVRNDAGVLPNNQYVFANTEMSSDHVVGWDTVHYMCTNAGIKNPSLNATNNRGRVSTLYAALELKPEERPFFYAHMGHTGDVNIGTYQRPLPIQEILKVGKHLQAFDRKEGKLHVVHSVDNTVTYIVTITITTRATGLGAQSAIPSPMAFGERTFDLFQ